MKSVPRDTVTVDEEGRLYGWGRSPGKLLHDLAPAFFCTHRSCWPQRIPACGSRVSKLSKRCQIECGGIVTAVLFEPAIRVWD